MLRTTLVENENIEELAKQKMNQKVEFEKKRKTNH